MLCNVSGQLPTQMHPTPKYCTVVPTNSASVADPSMCIHTNDTLMILLADTFVLAGQATQVDRLRDAISVEWAGSEALIYTQRNAQGKPSKVPASRDQEVSGPLH